MVIGGANSAGQAAVHFSQLRAAGSRCWCAADSLEKSMSHYLIEQIAALPNIEVRTGAQAVAAEGNEHLSALRIRDDDGERDEPVDAAFVFIGAAPRTDWLAASSRATSAASSSPGSDAKAAGWPLKRDPFVLETSVPGRVRRRRRARALDQARGERGRRGLDGRVA